MAIFPRGRAWYAACGYLVPPRHPQTQTTDRFPRPCAQDGLPDGAPDAQASAGVRLLARADDIIIDLRLVFTRQASAKPPTATIPPPAFRTRPYPADAPLRSVLQVQLSTTFRRAGPAIDALVLLLARLKQEQRRRALGAVFSRADSMWPEGAGASRREKMATSCGPVAGCARAVCILMCVLVIYGPI